MTEFLRLHEALPAILRFEGREAEGRATALAPVEVLLEGDGLPVGAVEIEFEIHDGRLRAAGRSTAAGSSGVRVALDLDEGSGRRFESFVTRIRKEDHVRLCLGPGVSFVETTSGFERYRMPHKALPEVDLEAIDTATNFLGQKIELPLLISSMTGGSDLARRINRHLAEAAAARGIAMGLGSMRILLVDESALDTFAVRDLAPDIPLFANIGAIQLNYGVGADDCRRLVEMVGADALVFHLNPIQEAVQPEGDTRFAGLTDRLAEVAAALPFPTIAKEVGNGISGDVARRLVAAGIDAIDVAGSSGTSWSRIESRRARSSDLAALGELFGEWGIPTADALVECRRAVPDTPVVASGGIRNGLEAAKAIALGAQMVGIARPFLEAANVSTEETIRAIDAFARELRVAMFGVGARTIGELARVHMTPVGA